MAEEAGPICAVGGAGLMLPLGGDDEHGWPMGVRALLYFLGLVWVAVWLAALCGIVPPTAKRCLRPLGGGRPAAANNEAEAAAGCVGLWGLQLRQALDPNSGGPAPGNPLVKALLLGLHVVSLPWKLLNALVVPPGPNPSLAGVRLLAVLCVFGAAWTIFADLAALLGCVLGLPDVVVGPFSFLRAVAACSAGAFGPILRRALFGAGQDDPLRGPQVSYGQQPGPGGVPTVMMGQALQVQPQQQAALPQPQLSETE